MVSLVESYGVELRQSGDRYRGLCPFHPDKRPSLVIYPQDQHWFCFGCHRGGDDIQFIREIEGCSFKEAKAKLGLESKAAARYRSTQRRKVSTLQSELKTMEDALERILVRSLKGLDRQLQKREITLCQYYTNRAIAEDRLCRFDALKTANHFYLRRWR